MTCDSVKQDSIDTLDDRMCKATDLELQYSTLDSNPARVNSSTTVVYRTKVAKRYQSFWGSVIVETNIKSLERKTNHCFKISGVIENIVKFQLPFLKRVLDLCLGQRLFSIPRALRVYHVISSTEPIFQMAADGDVEGIQSALAEGMSPFLVDEDGWTLLHVCSFHAVTYN